MDRLTQERRSWNMSRIRDRDTKPELIVRSILHGLGYRFRLNRAKLPGRPDVILTRHRTAVFVHGCFWHRHTRCRLAYTPKSNLPFWTEKFRANINRDEEVMRALRTLGWRALVVWECQTADRPTLTLRLKKTLQKGVLQSPSKPRRKKPDAKPAIPAPRRREDRLVEA